MSNLYESILSLCNDRGIKGGKMCVDLGLSKSTMTDLKSGRRSGISTETAQKIANYFGVSVERVLGTEQQKKLTPISESELDANLIKLLISLTPEEILQVDAFVQGLITARKD